MDRAESLLDISRLGLPLEKYILIYRTKLNKALGPPNLGKIKTCIEKISKLGQAGSRIPEDISISIVRPVLLYSYSPLSYRDLSSPALISGCLKIMSSLELLGVISPFSHELGYACFCIILRSLGLCLVQRAQILGFVDSNFDEDDPDTMWQSTTDLIKEVVWRKGDELDDCILGWFDCPNHNPGLPIISLSEAKTLLRLLSDDRQRFIRAIRATHLPGLPILTYSLWKYICTQRSATDRALTKELKVSLKEVLWRCWITSTYDDRVILEGIAGRDKIFFQVNIEDKDDCPIDYDDANGIIEILIGRLTQQTLDPIRYKPFGLGGFCTFIDYMTHHVLPALCYADRSARCFGAIIEWLWSVLSNPNTCDTDFNAAVGMISISFSEPNSETYSETGQKLDRQIIDEIINTDYVNLVGRVMLRLAPSFGDINTVDHS
ncbi:unnamed protein product [Rhizoctonia solani]|uniref:Uncharacterized protein n=1 Tax=Rhizoctonia solani TaxID=456999 RepID=A0A8H3D5S2_9AGAM|nr:unnamed protein product [Rhizoctonia solani]